MIAVIDYGAGNIFSVKNALDYLGFDSLLTNKKEDIEKADGLILPGVGAFPSAMKMLEQSGLTETIKTESKEKTVFRNLPWNAAYISKKDMNLKSVTDWV